MHPIIRRNFQLRHNKAYKPFPTINTEDLIRQLIDTIPNEFLFAVDRKAIKNLETGRKAH